MSHYGPSRLKVGKFLKKRGYRIDTAILPGRVYKVIKDDSFFALKRCSAREYRNNRIVLSRLENVDFSRLGVPRVIEGEENSEIGSWLVLSWEGNGDFHKRCDYHNPQQTGGREMETYTASLVLDIIEDLQSVDTQIFRWLKYS